MMTGAGLPHWGVVNSLKVPGLEFFRHWIERGFHGEMEYMKTRGEMYANPGSLFPQARSILMVAVPYRTGRWISFEEPGTLYISRYARGRDYHAVIRKRLKAALKRLAREVFPGMKYRVFVDTAPILERAFAVRAGLGWCGKNACLIHPEYGSYVFLGGALLDREIADSSEPVPNGCGDCTRCLDVCPAGAIIEPCTIDAKRCFSYLTVEYKGKDDGGVSDRYGWIFGCDLCQEVCPHNRRARLSNDWVFADRKDMAGLTPERMNSMTQDEYDTWVAGTAIKRMDFYQFKNNLELAGSGYSASSPPMGSRLRQPLERLFQEYGISGRFSLMWKRESAVISGENLPENHDLNAHLTRLAKTHPLLREYEWLFDIVDNFIYP